ncbi:MAG: tyrosine-type recombinase/integrase, partial [Gemmatimonadota bacterium]
RFEKLLAVAHQVKVRHGWGKEAVWAPSALPILIRVAGDSGRRISAILALRWSDWLPTEGTNGKLRWRAASDKSGKDWVVPVSPAVETDLSLELERRGTDVDPDGLIFPSPNDVAKALSLPVVTGWLRQAEKLADLEPMDRGAWHPFRRMWACQRKHLPAKDVAAAGGWRDVGVLQSVYEAADQETLEAVVTGGRRVKGILR